MSTITKLTDITTNSQFEKVQHTTFST